MFVYLLICYGNETYWLIAPSSPCPSKQISHSLGTWADLSQVTQQNKQCRIYRVQLKKPSENPLQQWSSFSQEYLAKCLQHLHCPVDDWLYASKVKVHVSIPDQRNSEGTTAQ